jgi:hypothetical protein
MLFIINKPYDAFTILDGILIETNITKSLKKARFVDMDISKELNSREEEDITTFIDKENTLMLTNYEQIEEVKMLSEVNVLLLDLDKCSLQELIAILDKCSLHAHI